MDSAFRRHERQSAIGGRESQHAHLARARDLERRGAVWQAFLELQSLGSTSSPSPELLRLASILKDQQFRAIESCSSQLPGSVLLSDSWRSLQRLQRLAAFWQSLDTLRLSVWPIIAWKFDLNDPSHRDWMHNLQDPRCGVFGLCVSQLKHLSDSNLKTLSELEHLSSLVLNKLDESQTTKLLRSIKRLQFLNLAEQVVRSDQIEALAQIPGLKSLQLQGSSFSDGDLEILSENAESVIEIDLWDTQITDKGIPHLTRMPALQRLTVGATWLSERGVMALADLKSLNYLNLRAIRVSAVAMSELQAVLPDCEILI